MDKLDRELHRMSKINPDRGFIKASRERLMCQIALERKEGWLKAFLKLLGKVEISETFLAQARIRLMARITHLPQPIRIPLHGLALFMNYAKKAVASTLVMVIAVTATLFFVEGNTVVEASDESYLEILSGTASVKHPDLIVWEEVNGLIEVQAGDLIKVEDGSQAVVRFFDDTELRLGGDTLFLISRLAVSPAFGGQAILEVSLHEGTAWVQTMNVEDGYAGFTFYTRDAVLRTVNGTFNVSSALNAPTSVLVLDDKLELTALRPETREELNSLKLLANQKASVHFAGNKPVVTTEAVSEQDLNSEWVQNNLNWDNEHLAVLREKGIDRLTQMAGTLPGQMLYPIKQAKERLQLALSSDTDLSLQIEIANRRLNEALVLFETGNQQKGTEALMAYQSMARQIAGTMPVGGQAKGVEKLTNKLIVPHQKVLTAELPNDASTGLVKEALHQTAEILADSPVELEKIRLANSVQRLQDVTALVEQGDVQTAKERLISQILAEGDTLRVVEAIEDEELKKTTLKEILDLRQEELALLSSLSEKLSATETVAETETETELVAMLQSASDTAKANVEMTLAAALPFLPELQEEMVAKPSADDIRMANLIDKIYIYKTWKGQQNQIERLFENELKNPNSIAYLISVRNNLDGRAYDYLNARILQLQKKTDFQKHKAMEKKIERNKRLRTN